MEILFDPIKLICQRFPKDTETIVTFKNPGEDKRVMVIAEYADFGQIFEFAKIGLEQCLDKMVSIF